MLQHKQNIKFSNEKSLRFKKVQTAKFKTMMIFLHMKGIIYYIFTSPKERLPSFGMFMTANLSENTRQLAGKVDFASQQCTPHHFQ
jgi:hypothetical protein